MLGGTSRAKVCAAAEVLAVLLCGAGIASAGKANWARSYEKGLAEAEDLWGEAQSLETSRRTSSALKIYEKIARDFSDLPLAEKAKARVAALGAAKTGGADGGGAMDKECRRWLGFGRNMKRNGLYDKAREYFEKVVQKYPDSKYAAEAKPEIEALK